MLIATTCLSEDETVCAWAAKHGYPFYRGSRCDVLDRYYQAAFAGRADRVVRITSDCPLIDPGLIDRAIDVHRESGADYVSDGVQPTLPLGESVEVFWFQGLKRAWQNATLEYERVHVTPYFYQNPDKFALKSLGLSGDYRDHRWTVDTPEDLWSSSSICMPRPDVKRHVLTGVTPCQSSIEIHKSDPSMRTSSRKSWRRC